MLEPRPMMTSARPVEIAFSVEYRWKTRTGVVGTQHRDGGAEPDPVGPSRDRGEDDVPSRHREMIGVTLAQQQAGSRSGHDIRQLYAYAYASCVRL
jgi:hypothetical protein